MTLVKHFFLCLEFFNKLNLLSPLNLKLKLTNQIILMEENSCISELLTKTLKQKLAKGVNFTDV
jgi:hypothetical protein